MSTIGSLEVNYKIVKMLPDYQDSHFWIGGYKTRDYTYIEDTWEWCDSSYWAFSNWASDRNGSQDYLAIARTLSKNWYDHNNSELLPSVCQHEVGKIEFLICKR